VTVINSTISGNTFGVLNSGTVSLINVTLVNNKYGIQQNSSLQVTTLKNSLVVENLNTCLNSGQFQSEGYNLFDQPCNTLTMQPTDRLFTGAVISPLLNQTHHALLPGSPAINALDSSIPGVYCPETDQRGVARGSRCDTGAYEYTAPAAPTQLFIHRGSNQAVGPMQMPHVPLEVYVLDGTGSPVAGVTVQFTAPSEGASGAMGAGSSASFQTGKNGVASASTFRANTVPGSYAVTASVAGIAENVSFQLTNGTILYAVGDEGSTTSDCRSISTACRFRTAVEMAASGDVILVKSGDFSINMPIRKILYLSGGWNSSFTLQNGFTRLFNGSILIENPYYLALERTSLRGTRITIDAGGNFKMTNGSVSDACAPINNAGNADFINVTFGNNYCASLSYSVSNNKYAGAIHNSGGTVSLTHVTMARNFNFNLDTLGIISVNGAGAIYNEKGFVRVKNSIVSNNRSNWFYDCRGIIQSLGNNIIGNSEGCTVDPAEGDLIGTLEKPVDPKLAGINSYESSPRTLSLLINSPAVDAADPSACPTHDQLGNMRPVGGGCDIGALEGAITGKPAPYAITFTSDYQNRYPGYMMCMTGRNECTDGIEDADNAHIHARGTVQFFIDQMGRNSLDDAGTPIVSTVQYEYHYDNAFWTNAGFQVVYGPGFSKADDVVAHEIVHGFTSLTSNLFYYYQSGAINESLSDLWGEYYDQVNKKGNDSAEIKWAIGEDLLPAVSGPVRNMKNPPAYKDPDKITSVYYYSGPYDNGGVHYNSGVNNKAVYLMVDGGSFNNRTVRALGWKKTSAIYYYAQTRLLTSASDYKDLYYALDQACSALISGAAAITADDCKQARAATDAVEMNLSPSGNFNPDAPTCPNGTTKSSDIYFEDFENGLADWSTAANAGSPRWSMIPGNYDFIYATSGKYALFGNDLDEIKNEQDQTSDSYAAMKNGITIPTGSSTMLHFNHAYGFEWENKNNVNIHYDGGVLEYTTDDGVSWIDAKPSILSRAQLCRQYYRSILCRS
jgi:hypothetical protein